MTIPQPVLKDTIHPTKPKDLIFILDKLRDKDVKRLLASMGILVQGPMKEIITRAAYSTHWDYMKTKLLRDMYAIGNDTYLLTGFLIEDKGQNGLSQIYQILREEEKQSRLRSDSEDDIIGVFDVEKKAEVVIGRFRYRHNRIKSDLQLFRYIPVDSDFSIYDTKLFSEKGNPLICVAIQPASSLDYKYILEEFTNHLVRTQFDIRVFALHSGYNIPSLSRSISFTSCEQCNDFMGDLLENPALLATQIRDAPSIKMFKWDRIVSSLESANHAESENIEEDLNFHLKDLTFSGVSLHKAKTTISALSSNKHAVGLLGLVFQNTDHLFYTNMEFKLQSARLDVAIKKITTDTSNNSEQIVYDAALYRDTLKEYWNCIINRYVSSIIPQPPSN